MEKTIYVNEYGNASSNLDKVIIKCPFFDYCGKFRIQKEKVCAGKEGNYTDCGSWNHYMEEQIQGEIIK